ncbi:hypothetical protein [Fibrella forsythiae]|uniref:Uncharacterized protein n=1 Tax=Fibrella forsythiae TaxID=2817061 RepID=A0ABS3JIK8_9BACT|nr:hypothetical protein [Fibrella forsythiae]MBO0949851.1 hypothetical protein [Fibrella forsythiae]
MKQAFVVAIALTLSVFGAASAQDNKAAKKMVTAEKKAEVAADKEALKSLKADRKADKMNGDKEALKADRKKTYQADKKMVKDQVKKDAAVVKEKL